MSKGLEVVSVILHTGKSPESRARHFLVDSLNSQDANVMQDMLIGALTDQNVLKRCGMAACISWLWIRSSSHFHIHRYITLGMDRGTSLNKLLSSKQLLLQQIPLQS